jgi:hypothetical protein
MQALHALVIWCAQAGLIWGNPRLQHVVLGDKSQVHMAGRNLKI